MSSLEKLAETHYPSPLDSDSWGIECNRRGFEEGAETMYRIITWCVENHINIKKHSIGRLIEIYFNNKE